MFSNKTKNELKNAINTLRTDVCELACTVTKQQSEIENLKIEMGKKK